MVALNLHAHSTTKVTNLKRVMKISYIYKIIKYMLHFMFYVSLSVRLAVHSTMEAKIK